MSAGWMAAKSDHQKVELSAEMRAGAWADRSVAKMAEYLVAQKAASSVAWWAAQ